MQTRSRRRAGWLGGAALAALLVAVAAPAARATAITTDPLHGFCNGTSPTGSCNDNGTNTPLGTSTEFGFSLSPAPGKKGVSGTLTLVILLPDTYTPPASFLITGVTGTTNPSGTATEFSSTAWTSGGLDAYLGFSASPATPIGGFEADGATGYYVYQVSLSDVMLFGNSDTTGEWNTIGALSNDLGAYIVGFFNEGSSDPCETPGTSCIATANSGALLVNTAGGTPRSLPEPGSLALLGTALVGMFLVGRKLNRRQST